MQFTGKSFNVKRPASKPEHKPHTQAPVRVAPSPIAQTSGAPGWDSHDLYFDYRRQETLSQRGY